MAINHSDKVIIALLVKKLLDLKQEDELFNFAVEQEGYGTKQYPRDVKLNRVSVQELFRRYPTYHLTKALLEFSATLVGYLVDHTIGMGNIGYTCGPSYIGLRIDLLERNGFEFANVNESLVHPASLPDGFSHETINNNFGGNRDATVFSIKINDVFVDFDLFLPYEPLKGLGEEIFAFTTINDSSRHRQPGPNRQAGMTREQINDGFDRRFMHDLTMWATGRGMDILSQLRHQRRKNVSVENLMVQLDISVSIMPEPKKEEMPKEEGPGARNAAA